jgi:hypothetical protein
MPEELDLDIVDKIMDHIPHWTWSVIRDRFIEIFVDNMTSDILQRLTGSVDGFDEAEEILRNHYIMPGYERELLIDAIKILNIEQVVEVLDRMELDKYKEPTDATPCSIEPQ